MSGSKIRPPAMQCGEGFVLLKPPPSTWIMCWEKTFWFAWYNQGRFTFVVHWTCLIYGHADILRSARCAQRLYSPYLLISKKIKELSLLSHII